MHVRSAKIEDAVEACSVLRRSITELCRADHHDDPVVLEQWLSNKTPDNVRSWISSPNSCFAVATEGGKIIGVGAMLRTGEITLNYISPEARFRGVSKAILTWLEARALELGIIRCTLKSTATARRFYLSNGYAQQGAFTDDFGAESYAMAKQLSPAA
jgi:GNAT superfamily N-acetyltransferase